MRAGHELPLGQVFQPEEVFVGTDGDDHVAGLEPVITGRVDDEVIARWPQREDQRPALIMKIYSAKCFASALVDRVEQAQA